MEIQKKGIVSELPSKENTLRGFARNFKIVEELYVFLLQRKEEASIRYISALPNLKVLSYAVSQNAPISPNIQSTYLIALIFGFLFPFSILYFLKLLDNKVNTREDLEKGLVDIPILGEIPFDDNTKEVSNIRGVIAESTRVLRSSLSFILTKETGNVITVTSTVKGEGKSFISYNIAKSYEALGKKVILVGADLRNPQIHSFLDIKRPNIGLSTYLSDGSIKDISSIITKYPEKNRKSAVMPFLYLAQRQNDNWIPLAAMKYIANYLSIPYISVYEVATFYTMYNLAPVGKHFIQVCTTTPCLIRGADKIVKLCKEKISPNENEISKQGSCSWMEVECLGACVSAPMVQINDDYYEDLDEKSTKDILESLIKDKPLKPGSYRGRKNTAPEKKLNTNGENHA